MVDADGVMMVGCCIIYMAISRFRRAEYRTQFIHCEMLLILKDHVLSTKMNFD